MDDATENQMVRFTSAGGWKFARIGELIGMRIVRTVPMTVALLLAVISCSQRESVGPGMSSITAAPPTVNAEFSADVSGPVTPPMSGHLKMGGSNPAGVEINANSQYLMLGGKPWTPVMGEIHYVRVPTDEWEDEILKMKAGGITVISTYCIWIYHEEVEGEFDWSGDRDIHRFLELCAKHGMYVYLRIGPWCHGEVRNGGLPDWVIKKSKVIRRVDPTFLAYTKTWYSALYDQVKGLQYKDGGPVIGIQLDNETGNNPRYLGALKDMAVGLGFDVPLYSYTGWNRSRGPADEMLPMYGGYPDGFWLNETGISKTGRRQYVFTHILDDANITEHLTGRPGSLTLSGESRYPYLTCEIGGGMAIAYARRPLMSADDVATLPLVKIGSGANAPGYYMYHGGGDLIGKLTTLQESQATNYPNDLPIIDYDFQAPIGQFGQIRDSYHLLRRLHMFLADFGAGLAPMKSVFPATMPSSLSDTQTLRWAVRSDGHSGFIFINNYQRGTEMPGHANVRFALKLDDGVQMVPEKPVDIPGGAYMIWPFNMDLNGTLLKSATVQPLCKLDGPVPFYVFFEIPGVVPQFDLENSDIPDWNGAPWFTVTAADGRKANVLVLPSELSKRCWKANLWGADRLLISPADVVVDGSTIRLETDDPKKMRVAIYPPPPQPPTVDGVPLMVGAAGIFTEYSAPVAAKEMKVTVQQFQAAGLARGVVIGSKKKPVPPSDADFDSAGVWHIVIPSDALDGVEDVRLKITYAGDVARAYVGDRLIDDDFYYGKPWEIGLKRFAPEVLDRGLTIKILPLPKNSPIYIQEDRRPLVRADGSESAYGGADLLGVEPEVVYEMKLHCGQ
jgi:beta-galactosidase